MPAALKILRDLGDGLMQLAQQLHGSGIERILPVLLTLSALCECRVLHRQPVHAAQKAAHPRHAVLLPIQIAVRRRGKQGVHARGIGAVATHHLVGRNYVALVL